MTREQLEISIQSNMPTNGVGYITAAHTRQVAEDMADYVDSSLIGYVKSEDLSQVALTGRYSDLVDAPTIPTKTSDLTNDSGFITASSLATVATSGSYNDLSNKPTIPTKTSDLTNDSGYVTASSLAAVATSGSYNDLSNKPTIPTKTSDLNNDSGFITSIPNTVVTSSTENLKIEVVSAMPATPDQNTIYIVQ